VDLKTAVVSKGGTGFKESDGTHDTVRKPKEDRQEELHEVLLGGL
jgi:molybdopterin biosynthesis enzyme MoaB